MGKSNFNSITHEKLRIKTHKFRKVFSNDESSYIPVEEVGPLGSRNNLLLQQSFRRDDEIYTWIQIYTDPSSCNADILVDQVSPVTNSLSVHYSCEKSVQMETSDWIIHTSHHLHQKLDQLKAIAPYK